MTLSFLSRGVNVSAENLTSEEIAAEAVELQHEEVQVANIRSEIRVSTEAIEKVLAAADVASGLTAHSVDNKLVAAVFGEHLSIAGIPDDVAQTMGVGLESAGEELGNEAFESAKELVRNIVAWLAEKWGDLKAFISRTFKKYFGSVKRATESWRSFKARVENYDDEGRIVEDKSKIEYKGAAEKFVLGVSGSENPKDIVAWSKLPEEIEKFGKMGEGLADVLADDTFTEFPEDFAAIGQAPITEALVKLKKVLKVDLKTFSFTKSASGEGCPLLGRSVVGKYCRNNESIGSGDVTTPEGLRKRTKAVNGMVVGIRPSNDKLKPLEEVKLEVASLDELLAVADSHIEVGTAILAIETGKQLRKVEAKFDKAIASTKKWAKDAEDDTPEAKRMAAARANYGVALLGLQQDMTLGFAGDLFRTYSAVSKAHGAAASKVLSRYKAA